MPSVRTAGAYVVAAFEALLGVLAHALGGLRPSVVPTVAIALLDVIGRLETLADVGATIGRVAQGPKELTIEVLVVEDDLHRVTSFSAPRIERDDPFRCTHVATYGSMRHDWVNYFLEAEQNYVLSENRSTVRK